METYYFNKSQSNRIHECSEILNCPDEPVTATQIRSEWLDYIQLNVEPTGWQAIYKVPKESFEKYKMFYRSTVVVMVKSVNWESLTATADVIGINDDKIQMPCSIDVNIIDLWPTKAQFYESIDATSTANCIDQLRFFYKYVWMPWDEENEDESDWVEDHLENRIQMVHSLFITPTSEKSKFYLELLYEAKALKNVRDSLGEELSDTEDDIKDASSEFYCLLNIQTKLSNIKAQVELYESFGKRSMILPNDCESNRKPKIYFITQETTIEQNLKYLSKIKDWVGKDVMIINTVSLETAIKKYKSGDTIILCPGVHNTSTKIKLSDNCKIQGLYNANETIIRSTNVIDGMLFSVNGNAVLENLTVEDTSCMYAVGIQSGELLLKKCILSRGRYGVLIDRNCNVNIENCLIFDFDEGIISNYLSKIKISNSEVRNCYVGLDLFPTTVCDIKESTINDCKDYGLKIETIEDAESSGDINILKGMKNVTIAGTIICNNKNSNVIIKHVPVLQLELDERAFT